MTPKRRPWFIAPAAICFVYGLCRFWRLTESCLRFDEIFSLHAASLSWSEMFWFVAQNLIYPPFGFVLLKLWTGAGGDGLFWARIFPIVFSVLTLAPFFFLCRELKLRLPTAALALFFTAVNGALIKYAQEVHIYAVFLFFAVFSLWIFARYFYKGKNLWLLTALNVFLIYTHYFGWLLVLSEIAAVAVLQRIKIRQMAVMFGILLAAFAPWIYTVWRAAQFDSEIAQNIGWIAKPGFDAALEFALDLFEPFYFQASSIEPASNYFVSVPLLLILAAAVFIRFADWKGGTDEEKQRLFLLLILSALPVAFAFAASWIMPYSIWGTRHLIFVFPPAAVLAALFLTEMKFRAVKIAFVSVIFILSAAAFFIEASRLQAQYIWCAWENLARNLDKNQPAKIYVFEDLVAYHFQYAVRESDRIEVVRVRNVPEIPEDTAYFLPRGFTGIRIADESEISGERFFVAFRDSAFNEKHPPLKNLKAKGYRIGEPKVFETPGLKAFLVEVSK
jgi:Predicted membrane protein